LKLVLNADLVIVDANPAAEKLLGLPREQLLGNDFSSYLASPEAARAIHAANVKTGKVHGDLLEIRVNKGAVKVLRCRAKRLQGLDKRVMITAREITNGKKKKIAPVGRKDRFKDAFECANVGLGMVDFGGNIFEANKRLAEIFGLTQKKLKTMNLMEIWMPEERAQAIADLREAASTEDFKAVIERRFLNKRGEFFFAEVTRGLIRSRAGKPVCFTFSVRDITESKRNRMLLEAQASTDPLTGAMNRSRTEERAGFELIRSDRYGNKLSLLMIDLDGFKTVNDNYGHDAGDRVLRALCDVARGCLRSIDILGRWGGDEFVALLPETGLAGAEIVAGRLLSKLENFQFGDGIRMTASIGVTSHREDEEFSLMMARADACLYRAKQNGRNQFLVDPQDAEREAAGIRADPSLLTLHWRQAYASGHPLIDAEHQELFSMSNNVIAAITQGRGGIGVLNSYRELIVHIRSHFAHEEETLQAAGIPNVREHAEIHRTLAKRACDLADQFEQGKASATELLRFLIHDIVARHMIQEDREFFPLLAAKQA
jgi:diguanylate cyclase (GGDEF)-like protein/hemerythrin-like metal-binding protein/PAS domain S-box-containing protein